MRVSINDAFPTTMAIGGLFTHSEFQGQGIGNKIMDVAERFVFADRGAELILLFCLASLREFYITRGWNVVTEPVLLEQTNDWVVYSETTMAYPRPASKLMTPLSVCMPDIRSGWGR